MEVPENNASYAIRFLSLARIAEYILTRLEKCRRPRLPSPKTWGEVGRIPPATTFEYGTHRNCHYPSQCSMGFERLLHQLRGQVRSQCRQDQDECNCAIDQNAPKAGRLIAEGDLMLPGRYGNSTLAGSSRKRRVNASVSTSIGWLLLASPSA